GVNAGTFYFSTAAFVLPPVYRLGNLGRNTLFGPATRNWDMSMFKNFAIGERHRAQVRAEFFDIFNQNSFGLPGDILNTPTFGKITSSSDGLRSDSGCRLLFLMVVSGARM